MLYQRTRHQINYPETYDLIFDRLRKELQSAINTGRPIKHLILLLGIPIAYPVSERCSFTSGPRVAVRTRLTSYIAAIDVAGDHLQKPHHGSRQTAQQEIRLWYVKLSTPASANSVFCVSCSSADYSRNKNVAGSFFNHFDGSIDLLDDLDDHYTARIHKKERKFLIEKLQAIAAEFSARITILGGDVHLAALGRFYSNPHLNIPVEHDHRYMVNVISSAITNKPPPAAVANLLARRNKIHHLDADTDETLLSFFNKDPGDSNKTAGFNKVTMPSRNFAILTENSPNNPPSGNSEAAAGAAADDTEPSFTGRGGHNFLHRGEVDAGTTHKAASTAHGRGNDGSLDVCIRVEIDQHDKEGKTEGYGLSVPLLHYTKPTAPAVDSVPGGQEAPPAS